MNSKERVRAVIDSQAVDRIPVSTWSHDFLREWSADDLADHTIERQLACEYDFVKLNPRWTMFAEPWGNEYERPIEQKFPRLLKQVINSADDIGNIAKVQTDHPVLQEYRKALAKTVIGLEDEVDVLATLFSPLACLGLLCGGVGQPLISYTESNPEDVHAVLKDITQTLVEYSQELLTEGASGLFYAPLQWTSTDVCTPAFYAEFGEAYDLQVLAAVQSAPFNMMHVCGNNIALDRFYDYPVHVLNWDNFGAGNPSLQAAAEACDKVVSGGVPHRAVHKLTSKELRAEIEGALDGVGDRVMLTGGCALGASIPLTVRQEIQALSSELS